MRASSARLIAQAYLLLALAQSLLAAVFLLRQPSESGQAVFLGFSMVRVVLAGGLLVVLLGAVGLLLISFARRAWFDLKVSHLVDWLARPRIWGWALVLSLAGFLGGLYLLALTPEVGEPYSREIFSRLTPLFLLISGLCAQTLLVLGALRIPQLRKNGKPILLIALFYGGMVGLTWLAWLWVVGKVSGQPESILGWNGLGVPILETQVFLAWLLAIGISVFFALKLPLAGGIRLSKRLSPRAIDCLLAIGIWLLAAGLWNSIPITPNWFVAAPTAPNDAYYPNSDALGYDLAAQIMLVGEGYHFVTDLLSHRPIHTLYLTVLHAIAGQEYTRLVFFQVLLLALFPALVFLLTRRLTNRLAGLLAALLIILREANSIAATGIITSSHVKSLMVDLPGAVGVALLLLLLARWLEDPPNRRMDLLLAGGAWGMLILLRQEFAGLALTIFLAVVIAHWLRPGQILKAGLIFTLGAVLVLSPWLWRNTTMVGLTLEDVIRYQAGFLRWRYSANTSSPAELEDYNRNRPTPTPTPLVPALGTPYPRQPFIIQPTQTPQPLPALGGAESQTPQPVRTPTPVVIEEKPPPPLRAGLVARFQSILLHTINNQDQLLFYLPGSVRIFDSVTGFLGHRDAQRLWLECCSLRAYLRRLPFWHKWDGQLPSQSLVLLFVNLFLLAVGLAVAWRSPRRLAAWLPLLVALNYSLVNAAIQNSGGRYILPVDWVSLVYFSAGLAAVSWWLWRALREEPPGLASPSPGPSGYQAVFIDALPVQTGKSARQDLSWKNPWLYAALAGLLLIGCTLPILENVIPQRFSPAMQASMRENLFTSAEITPAQQAALQNMLDEPGVTVVAGRALYPRWFAARDGALGSRNPLGPRLYPRLGFYLAGPESRAVVLPLELAPEWLPHAADVLVIADGNRQAVAVAVFDAQLVLKELLLRDPISGQ
jgi:hypothetical protein